MGNRTILVVGGAGYIGSHTARELKKAAFNVVIFDSLEKGHRGAVKGFPLVVGNLRDTKKLKQVFENYKPEAVLHFANYIEVGESVKHPEKFFENNVVAGENLLKVMMDVGCKKIVFSSSAAVYGEPKKIPINENEPTKPVNPYGESKVKFEKLLERYAQQFGLEFISLRYFNAAGADQKGDIGEDHHPETHLIPLILQVPLQKRDKIKIFGDDYPTPDGSCIRDFIHINDLAQAHIRALEAIDKGLTNRFYNLGNGKGFSVKEVIKIARKVTGHEIPSEVVPKRAGDPAVLVASSTKIQKELGWKAKYPSIETIIKHAWKWHKSHPDGYGS